MYWKATWQKLAPQGDLPEDIYVPYVLSLAFPRKNCSFMSSSVHFL